jgi:large subunit ribosomal protein L25
MPLARVRRLLSLKEYPMSEGVKITLENRTVLGKKVKTLRRQGILPATVYGKNVGPFAVQLPLRAFQDVYRKVGRTKLMELSIPGQVNVSAFVHSLQRHPVSREISHVDFLAVDLKIAITIAVPVHLVGTSPLVNLGDALLNQAVNTIEVSALPQALPSSVEVDISVLDHLEKSIHVRDLSLPEGATFAGDGDLLVVNLTPVRASAEDGEAEAPAEPTLIREKREDEE